MVISFSGIDSSGKTTQINLFEDYCKSNNIRYRKIWGKGRGTPGVMLIKSLVRRDKGLNEEQQREYRKEIYGNSRKRKLLLIASIIDLWWYFGFYYRFLNLTNKILICDRYIWDTYIDFRSEFPEFNIDDWFIWRLAVLLSPKAKYSFMFFITAEESYRRDVLKGDSTLDSLEIKIAKVDKYKQLIKLKKWNTIVDGTKNKTEISNIVLNKILGA